MTIDQARALLGTALGADPEALQAAFRQAVKQAHPDRSGGDAVRFHRVVEAYRLLRADLSVLPAAAPAPPAPSTEVGPARLSISPAQAVLGGELHLIDEAGRRLRIQLPPGLRGGDRLRAGETVYDILIAGDGASVVRGDDLWITLCLTPSLMDDGGRVPLETPAGPRLIWVSRAAAARGLVRLRGEGLPAARGRPAGDLFVRLETRPAADSEVRQRLRRFAAAWAA
ncbi:curved DNA-binding protein [Caulobacter ginsengisoli]|uniref:Curved DNA-binding protein n=1 Tax=Caulobacter ginsengisoli TaxID=400775 RepID=A0ABU0IN64_9CAUL|nr:molecular chaperone DnaJ [Caulobacter ginsengisoli]MDQ0463447.1 curved DNA-binding protein [Caulobacter ginsengisoli]